MREGDGRERDGRKGERSLLTHPVCSFPGPWGCPVFSIKTPDVFSGELWEASRAALPTLLFFFSHPPRPPRVQCCFTRRGGPLVFQ